MDDKRLDEIEQEFIKGCAQARTHELLEIIDLARLGIWANLHAIPALMWEDKRCGKVFGPLGDALSALPKEEHHGA